MVSLSLSFFMSPYLSTTTTAISISLSLFLVSSTVWHVSVCIPNRQIFRGIGFYPDEVRFLYFMVVFFVLMMQGETVSVMVLGKSLESTRNLVYSVFYYF